MIICFDCPPETKKILDDLIRSGEFSNYAETISVAVANQAVLRNQLQQNSSLIINNASDNAPSIKNHETSLSQEAPQETIVTNELRPTLKTGKFTDNSKMPSLFLLNGIDIKPSNIAKSPNDIWIKGQAIPLERWIFGQYNKLLPAKANCRALAHMLREDPAGIPLDKDAQFISEEALKLGSILRLHDEKTGNSRDEALSTAFPYRGLGSDSEKGRLRYANQFVGNVNKQGQVSGLLIDYKLINHNAEKKPRLLLTEPGWKFANLINPILDSVQEIPPNKFTAEEITFLLTHIANSVPAENYAYRAILKAIDDGADSPEKIDQILQKSFSNNSDAGLTKTFLSSQRSGTISRMADLGLVARRREGVRVVYLVTEKGQEYLKI